MSLAKIKSYLSENWDVRPPEPINPSRAAQAALLAKRHVWTQPQPAGAAAGQDIWKFPEVPREEVVYESVREVKAFNLARSLKSAVRNGHIVRIKFTDHQKIEIAPPTAEKILSKFHPYDINSTAKKTKKDIVNMINMANGAKGDEFDGISTANRVADDSDGGSQSTWRPKK